MPWGTKNGRRYYTRRWKAFGRVVRVHIGTGIKGEMAAAADAARRAVEKGQKQALNDEMARWQENQTPLTQLTQVTDFLTRTALVMSGLFKHGGEWRRNTHVKHSND